ncbi:MAG: hypothetical protein KAW41_01030 [Candidatus Diapherotrites archaeon]|nr:hypothetical protein [Candidatus Diapherotrites archaeon]
MRKSLLVLLLVLAVTMGCVQGAGEGAEGAKAPAAPVNEVTAREAFDMAYERASAEFGDVHLRDIGAGGTVVGHKKGHAAVEDGRSDTWIVTFEKKQSDNTFTLVFAVINKGELLSGGFGCYEGKDAMEISEGSWEEHAGKRLADTSKWNIDSPEAVEIAKQQTGLEGLGAMSVTADYNYLVADYPVYDIRLGPVSGEGGKGLVAYIDMNDGSVLKTGEISWR